jgi:hypothetical protein
MNTIGKRIEDEPERQPAGEVDKTVLGSLGGEPADSSLSSEPAMQEPIEKSLEDEPLKLPKGALVAMRKSGGLRFTSRTVVIHRDGQVTQTSITRTRNLRPPARLSNRQMSSMKMDVAKSMSGATAKSIGRQNPDAYAYEIVARVGRRVVSTEVFDGSMPASMAGLIKRLNQYLPPDRSIQEE